MTLSDADVVSAAADLFQAEADRRQIGQLSQRFIGLDMNDAYRIQQRFVDEKIRSGRHRIGWKIGLTSKAMQAALNIDIPDSGVLLDDMLFENGDTIAKERFIEPRVESEIAFVMRSDLSVQGVTRDDVLKATDYVTPSLEILDTRIVRVDADTGTSRTVVDTISDNAANAGVVLGSARHSVDAFDLRHVGAIVMRDGEVEETGLGAGVLNDPIESVIWLAQRMAQYGHRIQAGDVILSGSFIRPIECPPGARIEADFGEFGSASVGFAG